MFSQAVQISTNIVVFVQETLGTQIKYAPGLFVGKHFNRITAHLCAANLFK